MKLAKETLHVTLYNLYSGTLKLWLGLQFFIKEESRTAVFKILVRTLVLISLCGCVDESLISHNRAHIKMVFKGYVTYFSIKCI